MLRQRLTCLTLSAAMLAALAQATSAQTLTDLLAAKSDHHAPMVVEADRMLYDDGAQTITAEGDAQVYREGKTLEADRVTYFKATGRIVADGDVRVTEPDGTVTRTGHLELSGDFKEGFADETRLDTSQKTHFSAPRAERLDGDVTTFDLGTYTACDSCKDDPTKPQLWRVRARRIIHRNSEQTVYYESASLEFLGVPVAWFPFLSAADPSVTRRSGFLVPTATYMTGVGAMVSTPYFYVISPDRDVTLSPTWTTTQGFFGQAEYRQRTDSGFFNVKVSGVEQRRPELFPGSPWGPGDSRLRGDVQSVGKFQLADEWKFGWDVTWLSDRWFLGNYGVAGNPTGAGNFFREASSMVYLTGQGDRGYFDLRGFAFQATANSDFQPGLANVAVLDYNKTIDLPRDKSYGIGGQIEIDANVTRSAADAASYQQTGSISLDRSYGLFPTCRTPSGVPAYTPGSCILRGLGGDYTSATLQASWQSKFIDPVGEVWTPFAFARVRGDALSYDTSRSYALGPADSFANASQSAWLGSETAAGQATPGVGVEWRYPLIATTPVGRAVVEPIAQVIARPDGPRPGASTVNLDAQSLVFDDSSLFEWSKFSGYDRFETGARANYGARMTLLGPGSSSADAVFGQSRQIAGANPYASADAANIGISSGLDTRNSDYVSRVALTPAPGYAFVAKARFAEGTWEMRRIDLSTSAAIGPVKMGAQFADYDSQPLVGFPVRREGLSLNSRYDFLKNYYLDGNVAFDLGRRYYDAYLVRPAPLFSISTFGVGGGYKDECSTFSLRYLDAMSDNYGNPPTFARNRTVMLTLELRTLGELKAAESLGPTTPQDGLRLN